MSTTAGEATGLPPFAPILQQYIDSTMLTAFKSCQKKFYYEFVRGIRPRGKSIDLHAGGCFAKAVETVRKAAFSGMPLPLALALGRNVFELMWGDFVVLSDKAVKNKENMWRAVESYMRHYGVHTDRIQPYMLRGTPTFEYSFAIPLDMPGFPMHPITGLPFIFCGRMDQLGAIDGGSIGCIMDDKTSARGGPTWTRQWDMRGQFMGYLWACKVLGIKADHVCVRGVIIHKDDIEHLMFGPRAYPDHLIDRWFDTLRHTLVTLVNCWNTNEWNYNFGDACTSYSGCQFAPLCESPDYENWLDNYVENRWNPLHLDPLDPTLVAPEIFL